MMRDKRDVSIAVLGNIFKSFSLLSVLLIFFYIWIIYSVRQQTMLVFSLIAILAMLAVLLFITGEGLLKLKKWSLNTAIILSIILGVLFMLPFILTFFLTRPKVREKFSNEVRGAGELKKKEVIEEKKPVGIKVVGVIFLLIGIISYLPAGAMILGGPAPEGAIMVLLGISLRFFIIGIPIAEMVAGVSILCYNNWGRILGVITGIIASLVLFGFGLYGLIYVFTSKELSHADNSFYMFIILSCFIGFLVFILTIPYLMRQKVKEQFK